MLGFVSPRARTETVAISISSAVFYPFMRDPRRISSKVDHEVQGLNGVTGFIPLIDIYYYLLAACHSLVEVRSIKYESQRAIKGCTLVIFSYGRFLYY